jgi:hypothetical protein
MKLQGTVSADYLDIGREPGHNLPSLGLIEERNFLTLNCM